MSYLYRHFNAEGILLYVGISLNHINRLGQHKDHAHWFESITEVKIEKLESREAAIVAERKAILVENPLYNIKRPTITEQKKVYKESTKDLVKRLVQFNPTYSVEELIHILGMHKTNIVKDMDSNKLSFIEVKSRMSSRYPNPKIKRRVTGWQLIEYIEYLERKKKETL